MKKSLGVKAMAVGAVLGMGLLCLSSASMAGWQTVRRTVRPIGPNRVAVIVKRCFVTKHGEFRRCSITRHIRFRHPNNCRRVRVVRNCHVKPNGARVCRVKRVVRRVC